MSELAEFLTARYDELERLARQAIFAGEITDEAFWPSVFGAYNEGYLTKEQANHIGRHDPARELRRLAGLRRIVAAHSDQHECADYEATQWPYRGCDVLRDLAVEFSDHPGYKQEGGS